MQFLTVSLVFAYSILSLGPSNASPQQLPQLRSLQLGPGAGGRPTPLTTPQSQIPNFSQQLTFGPQQQQSQVQSHPQLFRGQQPQPQHLQSNFLQQPYQPQRLNFSPIGPFPLGLNTQQQPQPLKSSQTPITPVEEEEYEDEEYDDTPPANPLRTQPPQSIRPVLPQAPIRSTPTTRPAFQRSQLRIPSQQQSAQISATPPVGPPRFLVSPQPQQQQQIRRPVQSQPQITPRPQHQQLQLQQQPLRQFGQDSRLIDGDRQNSTPAPIKTLDRYMRTNDDGSTSWGYTNEDGTFKEETLGVDCVVRGKYGYVDPDGVKREYEYQSGNPCDPNKRGQPQEDDDEEVVQQGQQRLNGLLNARPVQYQQPQQSQQPQFRQRQHQVQQQ